jgi:hypothetical protein
MHESLPDLLRRAAPLLVGRWRELLALEPVSTALARPETLSFLMPWTIEEVVGALMKGDRRGLRPGESSGTVAPALCECGLNPLLVYFSCLERVLDEYTMSLSGGTTLANMRQRQFLQARLRRAVRGVAAREIDSFCAVCQRRRKAGLVSIESCAGELSA